MTKSSNWQPTTPPRPAPDEPAQTYAVHVELGQTTPTPQQLHQLADRLTAHHAETAINDHGYLTVQLPIPATDILTAAEQALILIVSAAQHSRIADTRIMQLNILHDLHELPPRVALPPPDLMPRLLSKAEAADQLGVSPQLMNRYANQGRWGAIRIGTTWAFPAVLIDQEKHRRHGTTP